MQEHSIVRVRQIPEYPGYAASRDGRIWSRWLKGNWKGKQTGQWHELSPSPGNDGRLHVNLYKNGRGKTFLVHHLILLTYMGPRPTREHEGCHKNDNYLDNREGNLYWGTNEENVRDALRNGTVAREERMPQAKFTEETVREVLILHSQGWGRKRLAKKFGVWPNAIGQILTGRSWSHVTGIGT